MIRFLQLSNLIRVNPKDRITMREVVKHPWFWDKEILQTIDSWLEDVPADNSDNENVHPTQGHRAKKFRVE